MIGQKVKKIMLAALLFSLLSAFVMPISAFAYNKSWDQGHKCVQGLPGASGWGRYGYDTTSPSVYRGGSYTSEDCCKEYCTLCPVYANTGRLKKTFSDLTLPGVGPSLAITRTYLSQDWANTLFGRGWIFNFGKKLIITRDGNGEKIIVVRRNQGEENFFKEYLNGTIERLAYYGLPYDLIKNTDGTYTIANKDGSVQLLDVDGKTISIVDKNGNNILFTYNNVGCLSRITNASGNYVDFVLGANGKVANISDNLGRSVGYTYDTSGNLIAVTDPMGNVTQYAYDSENRMTSITDPRGNLILGVTYDSFQPSRIATLTEKGKTWTFTYYDGYTVKRDTSGTTWTSYFDDVGIIEKVIDPLGNEITRSHNYVTSTSMNWEEDANGNHTNYTYDDEGNITTKTDPLGNTWTYNYISGTDLFETEITPLGITTKYEYDTNGNQTARIRDFGGALENSTTYTYDGQGNKTSFTDPLGNTTSYEYNSNGNLIKEVDPIGNTKTFTYDARGNRLTSTNANGQITTYNYDLLDRLTSITDPSGNTINYTYDAVGNKINISLPNGAIINQEYDAFNRLIKTTDSLGHSLVYTYDQDGNIVSYTDANGNSTNYSFDAIGRRISMTTPTGYTTNFSYDAAGNIISVIDANGNTTTFTYDALNRRVAKAYPDGNNYSYSYDAVSRMLSQTDPNGSTINYVYDQLGRLKQKHYPDGTNSNYTYDLTGKTLTSTNPDSSISYTYDAMGRVLTNTQNGRTISYSYDNEGNRISMITPEGEAVEYSYNHSNFMTNLQLSSGKGIAYTYDSIGRITMRDYFGGVSVSMAFDNANRLLSLTYKKNDESVIYNQTNLFDNTVNILQKTTDLGTTIYTYDKTYQLLSANHPVIADEQFSYDPVGNRLTSTDHNSWTYNNRNELQNKDLEAFIYDNNGNMIAKTNASGTTAYNYNFENQLVRVDLPDGEAVTYKYDEQGRRIEKNINGVLTKYLYDFENILLAEYDTNGGLKRNYFNGTGDVCPSIIAEDGLIYFLVKDHLDTPQMVVNESGDVVWSAEYKSFGMVDIALDVVENNFRFPGQYSDSESGLYYNFHRYYDPEIGRYITSDPIGLEGGINLYAYVINNPVTLSDNLGLDITLETGNNSGKYLNDLVHQAVCVDDCIKGKTCFSFAMVGFQLPQFTSTWLGWDSPVVGAILKGEVYSPSPVSGAAISKRHKTTVQQDKNWLSYMMTNRLGTQDAYSVARHNCRKFSQWEFRDAPLHW